MKRSRLALAAILMPAMILSAGGRGGRGTTTTTTTCTPGSSNGTPAPSLPTTVTGIQTRTTFPTTYNMLLSGVSSGLALANGNYGIWCISPSYDVPNEALAANGQLLVPTGKTTYKVYNSYATNLPADGNTGIPGPIFGGGGTLTVAQELQIVNYILNHPRGFDGTIPASVPDIQAAIWQVIHPDGLDYLTPPGTGPTTTDEYALALYQDAVAHGIGFIPGVGQFVGVILDPVTPSGASLPFQGVIVPVCVPPTVCSGTSSISLTKTANVTSANPFQLVTFTYVVKNTGTNTLNNIVVHDDNGTPSYSEDDVTVGTAATLAAGKSITFTSRVYLPIKLFYQDSHGNPYWDTLIPQIPSSPANSLMLTYLQDPDATDNTYGNHSSAGWGPSGQMFSQLVGSNYAEFQFFDSKGNLVSDFNADYISTKGSAPSGFGSLGLRGNMIYGNSKYLSFATSTLDDNLNGYAKFYSATVNSPLNDENWQKMAGYKVVVDQGMFGWLGLGSVSVKSNHLGDTEYGYGITYTPKVICSRITNTATVCAYAANCCKTYVQASASYCVTLNGSTPPSCPQNPKHICTHFDQCRCTCAKCSSGDHAHCTLTNCSDVSCRKQLCQQQCQCFCTQCLYGNHSKCTNSKCKDSHCR